jgi:hypothetical protein
MVRLGKLSSGAMSKSAIKVRNPLPGRDNYTSAKRAEKLVRSGAARFVGEREIEFLDSSSRARHKLEAERSLRRRLTSPGYDGARNAVRSKTGQFVFALWSEKAMTRMVRAGGSSSLAWSFMQAVWRGHRPRYEGVTIDAPRTMVPETRRSAAVEGVDGDEAKDVLPRRDNLRDSGNGQLCRCPSCRHVAGDPSGGLAGAALAEACHKRIHGELAITQADVDAAGEGWDYSVWPFDPDLVEAARILDIAPLTIAKVSRLSRDHPERLLEIRRGEKTVDEIFSELYPDRAAPQEGAPTQRTL